MHELLRDMSKIIRLALQEDAVERDITTFSLMPEHAMGDGTFLVKAPGVIAGLPVVRAVLLEVDPKIAFEELLPDGSSVRSGQAVATVKGPLASILRAERLALNFLQQLSGVATETSRYVAATEGLAVKILDTRKTTPGLRHLQKYAVQTGGGRNHRMDLADGMLVKDNHIAALRAREMTLRQIVRKALHGNPTGLVVEIEVTTRLTAGRLRGARFGGTIALPPEVAACIGDVFADIRIPDSGGSRTITIPLWLGAE